MGLMGLIFAYFAVNMNEDMASKVFVSWFFVNFLWVFVMKICIINHKKCKYLYNKVL